MPFHNYFFPEKLIFFSVNSVEVGSCYNSLHATITERRKIAFCGTFRHHGNRDTLFKISFKSDNPHTKTGILNTRTRRLHRKVSR